MDEKTIIFIINLTKQYLSIEDFKKLRLISQSCNAKFTPWLSHTITKSLLTKPNALDYLKKFGKHAVVLKLDDEIENLSVSWDDIQTHCPNINKLIVNKRWADRLGNYPKFIETWPHIEQFLIDNYDNIQEVLNNLPNLKHLSLKNLLRKTENIYPPLYLPSLSIEGNSLDLNRFSGKYIKQCGLKRLKINIHSCYPCHQPMCQNFFENITKLALDELELYLAVDNSFKRLNIEQSLQFLNISKLKSLNLCLFSKQTSFLQSDGDSMDIYSMPKTQTILTPVPLISLFMKKYNHLTNLTIPTVTASLLDLLLSNCPKLTALHFNSLLPPPHFKEKRRFSRLQNLSFAGFENECAQRIREIRGIFPKLSSLQLKRRIMAERNTQETHNCNLLLSCFPNVGYIQIDEFNININDKIKITKLPLWHTLSINGLRSKSCKWIKLVLNLAKRLEVLKVTSHQPSSKSKLEYMQLIQEVKPELVILYEDGKVYQFPNIASLTI